LFSPGQSTETTVVLIPKKGLVILNISATEARSLPQNNLKKQTLVWLIKRHTVVAGEWSQKFLAVTGK
jgi:hypothetical protein